MYEVVIGRSESDLKKFGLRGTIFLGKLYVKMGQTTSLSNKVYMDVARSHVILVSGKRGSGKCLHGDTLIQLNDGTQIPIRNLKNNNQNVYSLNKELKIQEAIKDDFFEREVDKLIHLKLRSGREINLTPEHPLLTIEGWIPVKELNLNDRVAVPRKIPFSGKSDLENHKIILLAYLIAEGHLSNGFVLFSNNDSKIVNEFKDIIKNFDNNLRVNEHSKKGCYRVSQIEKKYRLSYNKGYLGRFVKGSGVRYEKSSIRKWLEGLKIYNKLSKDKFIPEEILKINNNKISLFLNRLFSCDGSIYKTNNNFEISYSSSSKKLIKQVQSLLLRFEIISKLRNKKVKCNGKIFDSFELVINGINVNKYIENIGFFGIKEEKQKIILNESIKITRNPNIDTIPKEIWDNYRPKNWVEIGKAFNYSTPKALRTSVNYAPTRQKLLQIAISDQNEKIKLLAESDIFWDEIISIRILEGNFKVYDISIPETHNFIANDIIVHNSYSLGVIAEEMVNLPEEVSKKLAILIIDTMGIYWTMKYPNEKDEDLLAQWGLEKKSLDINLYVPAGFFKKYKEKEIPADYPFTIQPSELDAGDWCGVFGIKLTDTIGILIERTLKKTKKKFKNKYNLDDIIKTIHEDEKIDEKTKLAAENRFAAAKSWGLFSKEGTPIKEIIKGGKTTVIDISAYTNVSGNWSIKGLVVGLICRKLMSERMLARKISELEDVKSGHSYFIYEKEEEKEEMPLVWILIDEAHEFLTKEGSTPATGPLVQILREGRQPGVSLILATQQPGEIHKDVITQTDIVLSHRITAKKDVTALNDMMQSYLPGQIQKYLNLLPRETGAAIILDDNSERMFPIRVKPRFTWHGGEAPTAVKAEGSALRELEL